jgi:hypothetical protein
LFSIHIVYYTGSVDKSKGPGGPFGKPLQFNYATAAAIVGVPQAALVR